MLLALSASAQDCIFNEVMLPANAPAPAMRCEQREAHPGADVAAGIAQVQATWKKQFGVELAAAHVGWSDAGYVSLPFERFLTDQERAAEQAAEGMVTDLQREKATSALGPERHGGRVYQHFLGADTRLTDFWGQPGTVALLLELASGWYDHCVGTLSKDEAMAANPDNCTLQIGDIAYFAPVRPDPLGHYDHYEGHCTDLRLFRTDGSRYEAFYNKPDDREGFGAAYNQALTKAFVAYTLDHFATGDFYFNDPVVHEAFDRVQPMPRHDDHLHLCFDDSP